MSWLELKQNDNSGGNASKEKTNYIKFPVGVTPIRVMDEEPLSRWTHWIPQANGGKGLSITCIGGKNGCPVCKAMAADKAKDTKSKYSVRKQHAINVIDRRDGKVGIVDQSSKFFESLLAIMEQMGDLRNYDVTVTRKGTGLNDTEYHILPKFPPTPLTEAEKALELYKLNDMYAPFTMDEMMLFMGGATMEDVNKLRETAQNTGTVTATSVDATTTADAPVIHTKKKAEIGVDFTEQIPF